MNLLTISKIGILYVMEKINFLDIQKDLGLDEDHAITLLRKLELIKDLDSELYDIKNKYYDTEKYYEELHKYINNNGLTAREVQELLLITEDSLQKLLPFIKDFKTGKYLKIFIEQHGQIKNFVDNFNQQHPECQLEKIKCDICDDNKQSAIGICNKCGRFICQEHEQKGINVDEITRLDKFPMICINCGKNNIKK